jgi:ribosome-associated protein
MRRCILESLALAQQLVRALEEKKAESILLLDVQGSCPFADYFVLCTGSSERMLRALAEVVAETAHRDARTPARLEGHAVNGWILVDMGAVVAHILSPQRREYYDLEDLWKDARKIVQIQ